MVKRTKTICRLLPTNCLNAFDHFVGLGLKGLKLLSILSYFKSLFSFQRLFLGEVTANFFTLRLGLTKRPEVFSHAEVPKIQQGVLIFKFRRRRDL